jgi:uncharacterized Zn-binding protein involved in type VI secretion
MPAIARKGDPITTGHGCDAVSTVGVGSSDVFINGIAVARKGDSISPHTIRSGNRCVSHSAVINAGSGSILVNGIPIARVGDSADAGAIIGGSGDVNAG